MKKIFILFLLFSGSLIYPQETRFIEVTGKAEIEYPADQVSWSVRISKVEDSLEESSKEVNSAFTDLLAILEQTGIDKNDIQVSPIQQGRYYENEYDRKSKRFVGFYSNMNISFILKDMSKYSQLVKKLSESAEFENLQSSWDDSNYEEHHRSTLIQASDNAKNKADYLAENLGSQLGSVLEIREGSSSTNYPNPFNTSTSLDYNAPVVSGKVSYIRSVTVKFELIQKPE
jgi:uncharacterized protein YggE